MVELRLTTLVGNAELRKLNFHVVFSDELSPEEIQQFFLDRLSVEIHLESGNPWRGCLGTSAGLEDLGKAVHSATPVAKRMGASALRIGFANAAIGLPKVISALRQSVFDGKFLTAIGLGEWEQMRWDGAGAAQKRDAIGQADFVFTASPSVAKYREQRGKLRADGVNSRLLLASDAHYYATSDQPNRLGHTMCWLKADLTFRGLQRTIQCFDDRVYIGDIPPKLDRIRGNKKKFIRSIEIRRRDGSSLPEKWFDTRLDINTDLVAVIGNQGSAKSALTDIIALCGQSHVNGFSFLTPEKFCDKQKKASEFTATLTWEDGEAVQRPLDAQRSSTEVERVRYVPQGFFDGVTNETAVSDGGSFYAEVKKAIFSHVALDDRLGCASFDVLVVKHTSAVENGLSQLRQHLSDLNREIIALEADCTTTEVKRVQAQLAEVTAELAALHGDPPSAPEGTTGEDADAETERLRAEEAQLSDEVERVENNRMALKKRRAAILNAIDSIRNEERRVHAAIDQIARKLTLEGVDIDVSSCLTVASDTGLLAAALEDITAGIAVADSQLDDGRNPSEGDAIAARLAAVIVMREQRERELEAASSAYEAYRTRYRTWEDQIAALDGSGASPAPGSRRGLEARLEELRVTMPKKLDELVGERRRICREIHDSLARMAAVYRDVATPVRAHIEAEPLTRDRYRLAFDVAIVEQGLADVLFNCISQSSGTFAGKAAGRDRLRELIDAADLTTAEGAVTFAELLLDQLKHNYKSAPPLPIELPSVLKQGATVHQVYDLVFGLEYLHPAFELALNGKPLRQLSPGERGILLLVFYLLVDCGDEPLIIDQPEGNLNNQSIVDHLVPVFLKAKERRQVIMVTHNPNLAVVCDAEQIIHCTLSIEDENRVIYDAGALENPKFTQLSLDLLEGTAHAFTARRATYEGNGRRVPALGIAG